MEVRPLKKLSVCLIALFLVLTAYRAAFAQAASTIWLETDRQTAGPSDLITIKLNASSGTPVQGFAFQLSYDPACLQPESLTSLLPGLNNLEVPQKPGLVDAIFASTQPLQVNGSLAAVTFKPLAACQNNLILQKASLAIRDASGIAQPVPDVRMGASSLVITVSAAAPQATPLSSSASSGEPAATLAPGTSPAGSNSEESSNDFLLILLAVTLAGLLLIGFGALAARRSLKRSNERARSAGSKAGLRSGKIPTLIIERGLQTGSSFQLLRFPARIGTDPANEIRLQGQGVSPFHAEIRLYRTGYALVDLGSPQGSQVNGRTLRNQQMPFSLGDNLRVGGVTLIFREI